MNRLLSFVLSCAMVMILCIPAFAINLLTDEPFDEPFVMDIDNGKLFSAASEDKTVAILTNDDLHLIDISRLRRQHLSGPSLLKRHPKILTWNTAQSRTPFLSWSA